MRRQRGKDGGSSATLAGRLSLEFSQVFVGVEVGALCTTRDTEQRILKVISAALLLRCAESSRSQLKVVLDPAAINGFSDEGSDREAKEATERAEDCLTSSCQDKGGGSGNERKGNTVFTLCCHPVKTGRDSGRSFQTFQDINSASDCQLVQHCWMSITIAQMIQQALLYSFLLTVVSLFLCLLQSPTVLHPITLHTRKPPLSLDHSTVTSPHLLLIGLCGDAN